MADNDDEENVHALAPFLEVRLPELGLDYETYSAYILPLLTDTEEDEDEWNSVMELLQASSETHSDNNDVWIQLKIDIENAWKKHQEELVIKEKQQHDIREHEIQEQLHRERQIALEAAAEREKQRKKEQANNTSATKMDDTKRALVERFAYENDDDDEKANNVEIDEPPISNKEYAKQLDVEKAKELRAQKKTTKKEEQQKTAQAKQNKQNLKEERRKRATKGERKR